MNPAPTPPTPPTAQTNRPVRLAQDRGSTKIGWLDSRHSFSFGNYYDPQRVGFHGLRVINDDRVAPGMGFDTHPHRDMEILTWVLDGELAHRDSMGHQSTLGPGGLQLMSAGTGIHHSEFNARRDAPAHFLQVWIQPRNAGTTPRYAEARPDPSLRDGRLIPVVTPDGSDGTLQIGADVRVLLGDFTADQDTRFQPTPGRAVYLHVATGRIRVDKQTLSAGDAIILEDIDADTPLLAIYGESSEPAQLLLFDLPG